MEFNADVLKISMTNDQYWDLMLLLDWLAAYDELRVSVALEKLVCCELSDEMLPPYRLCGFRKHFSDREPCGNFAMYSSLRSAANLGDHPESAGDYCEYRCEVHRSDRQLPFESMSAVCPVSKAGLHIVHCR